VHPPVPRELARAPRGLTLIELIVVICIIGVLGAVLLDRLRFYQEVAEKAAMESNLGTLRSALQLQVAAFLLRGEGRKIASLAGENPFGWLQEPPPEYRGEFRAPQPALPRGSWYFDAAGRQVVYIPSLDGHLERLADGSKRLRFQVKLDLEPASPGSERKQGVRGMRIEPVLPYVWFYKP
jgi:general secretion pathway protein G